MNKKNTTRKNRGPESEHYDSLKGCNVFLGIESPFTSDVKVKLLWVDRYTIGVQHEGKKVMLSKKAFKAMWAAD